MFKGIIIEDGLEETDPFKGLTIEKTWQEGGRTIHLVSAEQGDFPDLARCLKDGPWYMHFWDKEGDEVVVLYKKRTFRGRCSDPATLTEAKAFGTTLGIPDDQLQFWID
jgi:hypothetical protein